MPICWKKRVALPWYSKKIPASLAERVAKELTIPVIGIGAGGKVDGQVLVVQDMLGMSKGFSPRFLRRYADLRIPSWPMRFNNM